MGARPAAGPMTPMHPAGRDRRAVILFLSAVVVVLAADLGTKWLAFNRVAGEPVTLEPAAVDPRLLIPRHEQVVVVPGVLSLKLTANTGAIFGIGKGAQWLFVVMTGLAVGVISWMFWRSDRRDRWLHVSLGMILAGALGNLYDRLKYHAVRDLLYLFPEVKLPLGLKWPNGSDGLYPWIFNLADADIFFTVGNPPLRSNTVTITMEPEYRSETLTVAGAEFSPEFEELTVTLSDVPDRDVLIRYLLQKNTVASDEEYEGVFYQGNIEGTVDGFRAIFDAMGGAAPYKILLAICLEDTELPITDARAHCGRVYAKSVNYEPTDLRSLRRPNLQSRGHPSRRALREAIHRQQDARTDNPYDRGGPVAFPTNAVHADDQVPRAACLPMQCAT